jgi:hypothetical protein
MLFRNLIMTINNYLVSNIEHHDLYIILIAMLNIFILTMMMIVIVMGIVRVVVFINMKNIMRLGL